MFGLFAFIIAIIALVLVIINHSEIKELKKDNQKLRNIILNQNKDYENKIDLSGQNITKLQPQAPPIQQQSIQKTTKIQQQKPIQQPVHIHSQKPEKNVENIFGKNVLGVLASVLIFIGIIAFGTLIFSHITNTIKIFAMFIISFAITGAGIWLTKKNSSTFSQILMGCGLGSVYISILVTHIYFGAINDIVAFLFILIWGIATWAISKHTSAKILVYIAHIGCMLSILLSLGFGASQQKFIEITIYQLATVVLLFVTSYKEYKVLFKISANISMFMNMVLSAMLMLNNSDIYGNGTGTIMLVFATILMVFNSITYILLHKTTAHEKIMENTFANISYFISFAVGFVIHVAIFTERQLIALAMDENIVLICGITLASTILFLIGTMIAYTYQIKDTDSRKLTAVCSEIFLSLLFLILSIITWSEIHILPLISIFAIANAIFAFKQKTTNPRLSLEFWKTGFVFLIVDAIISIFFIMSTPYTGFIYSIILCGLLFAYIKIRYKHELGSPIMPFLFLNLHFAITMCNLCDTLFKNYVVGLLVATLLNMVLYCIYHKNEDKYDIEQKHYVTILMEILESTWVFVMAILICVEKSTGYTSVPTLFMLSIAILTMALIRIKDVIKLQNGFLSIWYAIKFTMLTMLPLLVFTSILDEPFIFSLFLMIIAVTCIWFGFKKELKPVRIYGLILIMMSVFKMVVIDVWNQQSIIRVITLIIGGIICFGISAAYTKIEKKQIEKIEKKELTEKDFWDNDD